jgi:hypothetical protein
MTYKITNPRFLPGNISGLGMEYTDIRERIVNTDYAIRLDSSDGCVITDADEIAYVLAMAGTVGDTEDRARALFVLDPPAVCHTIIQLAGMLARFEPRALADVLHRLHALVPPPPDNGNPPTREINVDDSLAAATAA